MITTKKHGRIKVYYWVSEERAKIYLLRGKVTVSQKLEFLFKHIKRQIRIPRAHLHLASFKDGYAIFDREGCRLYYAREKKTGSARWQRTAPFIQIETMHTVTGYDS
jgi:hypothetical protein